ncbi:hypothetical protein ACQPZF_05615 [Actinosynnema sp. CS-041913]|uniref:hypothetical protein n=1 Tax=Actinosynnema sp. CS-041913 TaxID=3239917 RepID=UPI003D933E85
MSDGPVSGALERGGMVTEIEIEKRKSELRQSLRALAERQGVHREDLLEILESKARPLRQVWPMGEVYEIGTARKVVRANLVAVIEQLSPRSSRQQLAAREREAQYRYALLVTFNLTEIEDLKSMTLEERRRWLAEADRGIRRIAIRTSRRDFGNALDQMAEILTSSTYWPREERDVDPASNQMATYVPDTASQSVSLRLYGGADIVHRPELVRQINALVEQGARLIALVGLPGMGKTALAKVLAPGAPFIHFEDGEPWREHLSAAVLRHHPEVGHAGLDSAALLAVLMHGRRENPFLVLDNLQSSEELNKLVPHDAAAVVIATCRQSGEGAPLWCHEILVDVMTKDEASQFARQLVPSLSVDAVTSVVNTLGRYPLAIEVACSLARSSGVPIQEICEDLIEGDYDLKVKSHDTLRAVLARTVARLRQENSSVVYLLAHIASCGHLVRFGAIKELRFFVDEVFAGEIGGANFAAGLEELQRLALIKYEEDPIVADMRAIPSYNQRAVDLMKNLYYFNMHSLVGRLLRDSLRDEIIAINSLIFMRAYDLLGEIADLGERDPEALWNDIDLTSRLSQLSAMLHGVEIPLEVDVSEEYQALAQDWIPDLFRLALEYMYEEIYERQEGDERDIVIIRAHWLAEHLSAKYADQLAKEAEYIDGWPSDPRYSTRHQG